MPEASYPEGYDILYDTYVDVLLYINNNHLIGIDGIETPNTLNASIGIPLMESGFYFTKQEIIILGPI